jgi:hypothetical protein
MPPAAAILAGIQASEAIGHLLASSSLLDGILRVDAAAGSFTNIEISRSPACGCATLEAR